MRGRRCRAGKIRFAQMIEQGAPAKSVIMARALPPRPSSSFKTTEVFKCVIQVSRCPRRVKPFDLDVVSIQQLPRRPNSATRSGANFCIADNAVGVRLEGNVFAEVVSGKVFCTVKRMSASHVEARRPLGRTQEGCDCCCRQTNLHPGSKPAGQWRREVESPKLSGPGRDLILVPGPTSCQYLAPPRCC